MEQNSQPKWEGKVSTRLAKATADQIWPLLNDFFNFHKWFPSLATCYGINGTNGEPGCIRYCAGFSIPSNDTDQPVSWSTERLTAVNHVERSLSYEMVDGNIGFKSYVSTVKVVPQGGDGQDGCVIEWSFSVDPVAGLVLDELVRKYEVGLQQMGKRMEDAVKEETQPKWEGKATAELKGPSADQIWSFLEDFCNIHKWIPTVDTCYQVEGELGQPGLVRYCASSTPLASNGSHEENKISWAKEKLLMINPTERCLSYEITENNVGFKSYVATTKVLPINGDGQNGCKIEWSFVADPIEGWAFGDLNSYVYNCLQFMAQKMEQAVISG
ncbi:unnamed protein product [Dovyalis caffra]|uniref:Lachrymatory factor synthase n=1 Tax=Dovyalis caffra TaxID=77055 RepID=A0AAV1SN37_9ROSI|nr:unnamed protein product [Dovyalis caffra]